MTAYEHTLALLQSGTFATCIPAHFEGEPLVVVMEAQPNPLGLQQACHPNPYVRVAYAVRATVLLGQVLKRQAAEGLVVHA